MKTTMSREEVIRGIVERDLKRQQLTEEAVLEDAPDLHQSACAQFGAWETALRYAGINVRRLEAHHRYTADRVIRSVQSYCRSRNSLTAIAVRRHEYRLYSAACRHFGTWRKALQAAGVDVTRLRSAKARPHDKQKVVEDLRQWQSAGHSLHFRDILLENHALAIVARDVFGSWQRVMAALAEAPPSPARPQKWDPPRVIEAIRKRQQEGKSLRHTAVYYEDQAVLSAARRHFGSWHAALVAAGVTLTGR